MLKCIPMKKLFLFSVIFIFTFDVQAQDFALKMLEESPRHHEWVNISSGDRSIRAFVAFPEVSSNAQAVVVIHENRGLTDWVRSMADKLAAEGFLAIAPDLLSDFDENISSTRDFQDADEARNGIYKLDPDQVTSDLHAVVAYISAVPGADGRVSVTGFCWGGSQSFRFATNNPAIRMAMVFYGTGPSELEEIQKINVPVYGFYGENDQRVNATIEKTSEMMNKAGKKYDYVIYPGAGHAYMRAGDDPDGNEDSKAATRASIQRMVELLNK
ncbi:MAG: dienelactone hydrolase family protein [Cyclobacteriaceae bacterium]|nr:dienelactone hydrolase family protein [Cyclobacteriaceae bacterium]